MKIPKVMRPEIEIGYKGLFGLLHAVTAILKVGIKTMTIDLSVYNMKNAKVWIIPRYTLTKRGEPPEC